MEVVKRDEMFDIICGMSDRQVDQKVKDRLKTFKGRQNADIKDEVLGLLDDCAYASWTSGLVMSALHGIWIGCGGTEQELKERNANLVVNEETKARYKWTTRQ